jgi:hypothetical protein
MASTAIDVESWKELVRLCAARDVNPDPVEVEAIGVAKCLVQRQHGRMGSITNRVSGELLHHVRTRRTVNSVEREYRRQPFRVARPADGQPPTGGETVCETCGEVVSYRIMSAASSVRRRYIWLVVSLAGVVLGLASFILLFWRIEGFDGWPVLGFAVAGGVVLGALVARAVEDGVRVGRRRGPHRHIVRSGTMSTEGYQRW